MHKKLRLVFITAAFLLTLFPTAAIAEQERGGHAGGIEHFHRLEVLLGNMHEDGEDGFMRGLIYEYSLTENF